MRTRLMRSALPFVVVGTVGVGAALAAPSASTVTIKVSTSALGAKILVNSNGFTLYHYADEAKGKIDCTGTCAKFWPPLLVSGTAKPVAGPGLIASKLGTIKRPDGHMQVTYSGLALYRYLADKKAGQVNGQGVEESWYAVTSAGTITKAKVTSAAKASSNSGSGAGNGSSSGTASTPATPGNANCMPGAMEMDPGPCYNY